MILSSTKSSLLMMSSLYLWCSVYFFLIVDSSNAVLQQSIGVKGRLTCGADPLQNTTVQIFEKPFFRPEKVLAATYTDRHGYFQLVGSGSGILNMNVNFKVIHDCDDAVMPCFRKVTLGIPSNAITRTNVVQSYFEAGTMNMAFRYPVEERVC